jgi:hypothetical protein
MLTKKEILENRKKWVKYLTEKRLYKHRGELQKLNGVSCCCLGHGCNLFKIPKKQIGTELAFGVTNNIVSAPDELMNLVGLHCTLGEFKDKKRFLFDSNTRTFHNSNNKNKTRQVFDCLSSLNDDTDATPKEIGMFIKAHLNDGLIFKKV